MDCVWETIRNIINDDNVETETLKRMRIFVHNQCVFNDNTSYYDQVIEFTAVNVLQEMAGNEFDTKYTGCTYQRADIEKIIAFVRCEINKASMLLNQKLACKILDYLRQVSNRRPRFELSDTSTPTSSQEEIIAGFFSNDSI